MGLDQWWGLQNLVSGCPGRFVCSEPDNPGWGYLLCQTCRGKSVSSWVHLCLHSVCNIHWHPHLSSCKCDRRHPISEKEMHNRNNEKQRSSRSGSEASDDHLPDRLVNPGSTNQWNVPLLTQQKKKICLMKNRKNYFLCIITAP